MSVALWVVSVVVMVGAAMFQRETGPTNPLRDTVTIDGHVLAYRLRREAETSAGARISIPAPPVDVTATLLFRRYPTADPYTAERMTGLGNQLIATLPLEPASGKIEYYITLVSPSDTVRLPQRHGNRVILRYKDPVPLGFLLPHIGCMFFAMLFGVRAGLGAIVRGGTVRRDAWMSLALMSVGGLVLGPIVQKHAFGAYWTGVPFGYDLTDNKTLLMWLTWLIAGVAVARRVRLTDRIRRAVVVGAAAVMLAVYLIPHSLRGSQLDYNATEHVTD